MRITDLEGRRVGVWGAGREGLAAVRALQPGRNWGGVGEIVVHTDDPPPAGELVPDGVLRVHGEGGLAELARCDVVIRSPGVSRYRPEVGALAEAGVKLTTGTNLWFAAHSVEDGGSVIAVTGTKGKSSTSALIASLVDAAGGVADLRGNIGLPLLAGLDNPAATADQVHVLELSSFQTSDLEAAPTVAVFTNLFAEHLNWHGSAEVYWRDKLRLAEKAEFVVVNALDERLAAHFADDPRARWYGGREGWHVSGDGIARGEGEAVSLAGLSPALRDAHMRLNLCAALTAIEAAGLPSPALPDALDGHVPLSHRLQDLGVDGSAVRFVNDSIATVPQAVVAGLDAIQARHPADAIALLVGGFDRGQEYDELVERISGDTRIAAVIGLPASGGRIVEAVGMADESPAVLEMAADMPAAIAAARAALPDGGVVLLSPGAPSFGVYEDFEHRGRHFAECAGLPWPGDGNGTGEGGDSHV